MDRVQATKIRKRKAESQDNERLSKRLSLLNLERDGHKLYVPVEQPTINSPPPNPKPAHPRDEDVMQLDDSKHKVYIYDIDAELSDSSESDDGKLVFLPDIEKHLREFRIPPSVLANSEGELAGNSQLVLYNIPSSLSVPEEQDSVRKAIIETRARARAKQDQKRDEDIRESQAKLTPVTVLASRDWYYGTATGSSPYAAADGSMGSEPAISAAQPTMDHDPDAMDLG
ncbi:hypothetical protein LSUE1_G005173 [Lachnellula suecica]|uniref:Uncharacterized protein n=1 Tax=Lachnellula suecica TaxID=602035 RepID=A0A8T9C213_9HELO|nr:hypothetical protein LSUE1_G005173 [Lachnellula suecica]